MIWGPLFQASNMDLAVPTEELGVVSPQEDPTN